MNYKTIIIANIAEAFEDALMRVKSQKERTKKVQIEHNLCDRTLLWEGDNKIVITPFAISPLLFEHNIKALGFKNCLNLFPKDVNINLSDAIIEDKSLMKRLMSIIKDNPGIRISPYAVTQSFIDLTECFKKENLDFVVEERLYKNSDWTVQFLDSKIGSRVEIDKIKDKNINTPKSVICRNKKEAIDVAEWFYKNNTSCVVKANFGEGGWGTLIFRKEKYKSWSEVLVKIEKEFRSDSIWDDGIIIVEEYITAERGISSGCPSSELFLSSKGPKITYLCDQVVTEAGNFLGVALGKDALNEKVKDKINKASTLVGKRFWELGYRGFFDIDFVLAKKNKIPYIIETNMRRTGGTHVYDSVKAIFGEDWERKCFCISDNQFTYGKNILSVDKILYKLNDVLYPINNKKRGVMLTLINKWKPAFGFVVIGVNKKDAILLYNKMLNKWSAK
ncbi:MAG: hypothetical protein UW11_C0006G0048 [Parcubacteria group bacterium GW2011_GWA2_43_9b]|uniref:ATP-grasp domain-containing protein n=1 Tax=Candidatus Portnoybacteria bacterium RIFCSPLOWO2_02_FULL_39_11 TaxID=1802001 RepID=A0A1G2FU42_9BACT|nr:MAG: hypothetical protein UW11_C0006G0048 [Parcubacteria group bacterium GW2011_GWA2_43_9b]OGZ41563.1 MAG: hypothetical protein A3B04_01255 [Candidatus Portnoybacteria bacterium RIFCSPLOWO2_02_FULL_39_11]